MVESLGICVRAPLISLCGCTTQTSPTYPPARGGTVSENLLRISLSLSNQHDDDDLIMIHNLNPSPQMARQIFIARQYKVTVHTVQYIQAAPDVI